MEMGNDKNISELAKEITIEFSPISPIIYTVLETAQSVVPECIELFNKRCGENEHSGRIHRLLYPSLMRAIMQLLLNSMNLRTEASLELDGLPAGDWEHKILSNNGLAGRYADRNYRILKALKAENLSDKLPPPGGSERKIRYYRQMDRIQYRMRLFPSDTKAPKHNIIYLWDNQGNSVSLYLACPRWASTNKAEAYFIETIEHPIHSIRPVKADEVIEEIDLPRLQQDMNVIMKGNVEDEQREGGLRK